MPMVLSQRAYCVSRSLALAGMVLAVSLVLGCGNDSKQKKVPVTTNQNLSGLPQQPGQTGGPALTLTNPQTQRPIPTTIMVARGDTFSLGIQLSGLSGKEMSYGFISPDGLNIQISGTQVTLVNVPQGLASFSIVARSAADCEALGKTNCRPNGRAVVGVQSFDIEAKYVVNAVDPATEFTKIQSSGGGLAGQMARGEGFIGFLGKMFMGGQGLGGIMGGMTQPNQPGQQNQQQPGTYPPGY